MDIRKTTKKALCWMACCAAGMSLTLSASALPVKATAQKNSRTLSSTKPKVVLVLMERINLDDVTSGKMPTLLNLSRQGALGVMNVGVFGSKGPESAYVTLGAGSAAMGDAIAAQGMNVREKVEGGTAGDAFLRMTGIQPGPDSVVHFGASILSQENLKAKSQAIPGNLGECLHNARLKTAVIGNSDDTQQPARLGTVVAMDTSGLIDYGSVGSETYKKDPEFPLGVQSNIPQIETAFRQFYKNADFIVIDAGDTARAERARSETLKAAFPALRDRALQHSDELLSCILDQVDLKNTLVMVVCPDPPVPLGMWDSLTPVVMAGDGIHPGVLESATTHIPGLICNTDISATVLDQLHIASMSAVQGHPVFTEPNKSPIPSVTHFSQWATLNYHVRIPIMIVAGVLAVLAVTLSILGLIIPANRISWLLPSGQYSLLGLMVLPLAALIPPFFFQYGETAYYLAFAFSLLGIILITCLLTKRNIQFAPVLILIGTSLVILVDTLTGNPLISRSPLAACPITGIRYYGLGNEYMGVLVGSFIASLSYWFTLRTPLTFSKNILLVGLLIICALAIGAPWWGANAGGAITVLPGFGLLFLMLRKSKITKMQIFWMVLGAICILILLTISDTFRNPQQQSHMGQVAGQIHKNGFGYAFQIILRKLGMNFELITGVAGESIILTLIPAALLWIFALKKRSLQILNKYPWLKLSGACSLLTIPLALLFNDSGIVPAAAIAASVVLPWLWFMMEEKTYENTGS